MINDLQVFNYGEIPVRTVLMDGEPWWVLADVCRVLDIERADSTARRLDSDEKGTHQMSTPGGTQNMTIINESGLYKVILRSDKPEAKKFIRWVTHEVLPAIRKTGSYSTTGQRALTVDDYLKAAQLVSGCRNQRLPYVLGFLKQAGFKIPEIPKPENHSFDLPDSFDCAALNRLMKEKGVSQRELSRRTGIRLATINSYVRGLVEPSEARYHCMIAVLT